MPAGLGYHHALVQGFSFHSIVHFRCCVYAKDNCWRKSHVTALRLLRLRTGKFWIESTACLHSFIISLPLRGFSLWGRIAIFFQSFPVPSRPGPSLWSFAPGLVILVFLALAFFVYRRNERSHERTLTAIAAEMGLQFQRRGVVGPQAARLPLFKFHRKAFAKNILSGILTRREVLIFDYFCPTFGQDPAPSKPIEQTVAAFRFPGTKLPLFHLEPRTPLDNVPNWVRKLLGGRYQAVTLDLNSEFSRRFLLQARDVNAV